ncbi:MAG TPA: YnbE family lipoprotein [Candidatus Cybelea sp.]|nr:YnbE family lipoprotein [Candidatus Cybelea sp.]
MPLPRIPAYRASASTVVILACVGVCSGVAGCNPTVKVEAPDKPIVINLNVKIEQEVRVKVDKDVENLVNDNPNLF